jgi:hypothetical protein
MTIAERLFRKHCSTDPECDEAMYLSDFIPAIKEAMEMQRNACAAVFEADYASGQIDQHLTTADILNAKVEDGI